MPLHFLIHGTAEVVARGAGECQQLLRYFLNIKAAKLTQNGPGRTTLSSPNFCVAIDFGELRHWWILSLMGVNVQGKYKVLEELDSVGGRCTMGIQSGNGLVEFAPWSLQFYALMCLAFACFCVVVCRLLKGVWKRVHVGPWKTAFSKNET